MDKFSLIFASCLCLPHIAQGAGHIAGNVQWNSTGKALTTKEIDDKYWVGWERDKQGGFSTFQTAIVKENMEKATLKLEHPNKPTCYLPLEVHVYEDLQKRAENLLEKGFANIYDYGVYGGKRALIMSLLGQDLYKYAKEIGATFYNWDELTFIALSAIDQLEFLHDAGWIHQDLKAENLMLGFEDPKKFKGKINFRMSLTNRIYMIDLGGARRHQDENGTCYPQTAANMNETVCTKPFYCRTLRKGLTQSRRDDMETLGYALLDMGAFKLPWDNCKNETKITEEQNKLCDDVESIFRQTKNIEKPIQVALSTYFFLLKKLFTAKDGFCQRPDYEAFRKCFDEDPKAYYFEVTGKQFDETNTSEKQKTGKQPSEAKTVGEQSSDPKSVEKKATGKKPSEPKKVEKKATDKKPDVSKPTEKKATGKQPSEPKMEGKKAAGKKPDESKTGEKKATGKKPDESKLEIRTK